MAGKTSDGNEKRKPDSIRQSLIRRSAISIGLATLIPEGANQDVALMNATRSWIGFDPAGALNWATTQAEPRTSDDAQGERSGMGWRRIARVPANGPSIPGASAEKDAMLSDAVQIVVKGTQVGRIRWSASIDRMPGEAYPDMAELIGSIGDPSRRDAAYEDLTNSWLRKDPDAARAWLTQSNLSVSLKNRLLQPPAAGPRK